ncbi:hypothetical protein ACIBI8_23130 [Streptomyces sp. NPDC050529]|uniref:hypothetical protein n=1 Tax=Streptomyces sp. NPDC050529 TaxID=3365624 RepID=UPI0037BAFFBD
MAGSVRRRTTLAAAWRQWSMSMGPAKSRAMERRSCRTNSQTLLTIPARSSCSCVSCQSSRVLTLYQRSSVRFSLR